MVLVYMCKKLNRYKSDIHSKKGESELFPNKFME